MFNRSIKKEILATTILAGPLVVSQLLQVGMGFIDMIMIGRLGTTALAAGGLGATLWSFVMVSSFGLMMGLPAMISQLKGGGHDSEIGTVFRQGLWLALFIGILASITAMSSSYVLVHFSIEPDVMVLTQSYMFAIAWGMPAICIYCAARFMSEGVGHTWPVMLIQIIALCANVIGNYMLIYGNWGAPALGVEGAGWSSCIVMYLNMIVIFSYIHFKKLYKPLLLFHQFVLPDWQIIRHVLQLSIPIAVALIMEMGLFATVALLMGRFGTNEVAAHQIAINYAALMYMIPLGISMAITIRVGLAAGAQQYQEAKFRGWVGIAISGAIMLVSACVLFLIPEKIIAMYTQDIEVAKIAISFLFAAALFQISDGFQVSATAALRGLKDTAVPMVLGLIAYWCVGFPIAWLLAFNLNVGAIGLWFGLIAGLTVAALAINIRFYIKKNNVDALNMQG